MCATRNLLELGLSARFVPRCDARIRAPLPTFRLCRRRGVFESVSGRGRHRSYWIDLRQFQQSRTLFGIHIESAVTFGMCIALMRP